MIETKEQRAAREQAEAIPREAKARRYAAKMGTKPMKAVLRDKPSGEKPLRNKSRAGYMREYRRRPKTCPHCGKAL